MSFSVSLVSSNNYFATMENQIEMKKVDTDVDANAIPTLEDTSKSESPVMENTNELELKMSPSEDKSQEETIGTMNSFGVILMESFNQ